MAQQTYLQIVNAVLVKLRESTVGSPTASSYSTLIGAFVNDAKREVESAWNWAALRTAVTFTSVIGQVSYDLTAQTNEYSRLVYDQYDRPMVFDLTAGRQIRLCEYTEDELQGQYILQDPVQTNEQPSIFSLSQSGHGFFINFLEQPTVVRNYKLFFYVPQQELSNGSDVLTVPWAPVRDLAHLYALDERGEEIGEPGSKAWMRYQSALASAIAMDGLKDPTKTDFKVD